MHCTLIPGIINVYGHKCQILEITCPNGYTDCIYVTEEPPFSIQADNITMNVWHYSLNQDGTKITLTGKGSNSVNFKSVHKDGCHETIIDWDLKPYEEPNL